MRQAGVASNRQRLAVPARTRRRAGRGKRRRRKFGIRERRGRSVCPNACMRQDSDRHSLRLGVHLTREHAAHADRKFDAWLMSPCGIAIDLQASRTCQPPPLRCSRFQETLYGCSLLAPGGAPAREAAAKARRERCDPAVQRVSAPRFGKPYAVSEDLSQYPVKRRTRRGQTGRARKISQRSSGKKRVR